MRIRVVHTLVDGVDGIEVLRGLAEGSRLVPTMFEILAAPYPCFACELQEHADRGGSQRSGAWRIVAEGASMYRDIILSASMQRAMTRTVQEHTTQM
jgi:hypothetical protein